jgi:hypothetical protein
MSLRCDEFIRRFMMHVLPKGLMRIRHYGLLANRCRKASLKMLRKILAQAVKAAEEHTSGEPKGHLCPKCHKGQLIGIRLLSPTWPKFLISPG